MSTRCEKCNDTAVWAWQPFGPADDANCFTTLGSHYCGFPVVKLCDGHKQDIQRGDLVTFKFKGVWYKVNNKEPYDVVSSPF